MDILLHFGAHRTGTTTFQAYLRENGQTLADHGLAVWTPRRTRAGLFDGLIRPAAPLMPYEVRQMERAIGRVKIAIAQHKRSGVKELFISEENLLGATRNNLREGQLYPKVVDRLNRISGAFGEEVRTIGLSIRSYDSYWASAMSFAVAAGHRMPNVDQLDRLVTQPRRWRRVITDLHSVFPLAKIVVWRFEDLANAPHAQLLHMSNCVPDAPMTQLSNPISNPSPSRNQLRQVLLDRGLNPNLIPAGVGRWMPFDSFQQDILQAQYADDMKWLFAGADGIARFATPAKVTAAKTVGATFKRQMDVTGAMARAKDAVWPPTGGRYGTEKAMV